jgi:hypothetical protein
VRRADDPRRRAIADGGQQLDTLGVEIVAGKLHVTANVCHPVPPRSPGRSSAIEPSPSPTLRQAPIDTEVRSFLAPIPLVTLHVDHFVQKLRNVVALACGDLISITTAAWRSW